MRFVILKRKKQKEVLVNLCALARYMEKSNVELFLNDPEGWESAIKAIAEMAEIVGGIEGVGTVMELGFKWKDGAG